MSISRFALLALVVVGISTLYMANVSTQEITFYKNYELKQEFNYYENILDSTKFNALINTGESTEIQFSGQPVLRSEEISGDRYLLVGNVMDGSGQLNVTDPIYDIEYSKARSFATPQTSISFYWDNKDKPNYGFSSSKTGRIEFKSIESDNFLFKGVMKYVN